MRSIAKSFSYYFNAVLNQRKKVSLNFSDSDEINAVTEKAKCFPTH